MRRRLFISYAFTALGFSLSAPLSAQDGYQEEGDILVQPTGTGYAATLGQELDRQLNRIPYGNGINRSGVVRVRFVANANGRPEQINLLGDSGNVRMDHAAMVAVRRLDNLGSPPSAHAGGQTVLVSIIFATDRSAALQLAERVTDENAEMTASGELDPNILAFTTVTGTRS
ncbi:energy transducer TonB [Erythrobacter alti]|uniref:energy transducer TonB family protein n=1 Tax=Erythrobacter alti TaxID=1896145 RepID=UPI0030F38077